MRAQSEAQKQQLFDLEAEGQILRDKDTAREMLVQRLESHQRRCEEESD